MKKNNEIKAMTEKIKKAIQTKKDYFGYISTIIFLVFAIMHISLSLDQYDVGNMNKFGKSVTLATLPQIDD